MKKKLISGESFFHSIVAKFCDRYLPKSQKDEKDETLHRVINPPMRQENLSQARKPVSIIQSNKLMAVLAEKIKWDDLDADCAEKLITKRPWLIDGNFLTEFLGNGGQQPILPLSRAVIKIDRSQPLESPKLLRGSFGLEASIVEEDERSLGLTEIDLGSIRFEHMIKKDETEISSEDRLMRLKKVDLIRLDVQVFNTLWENKSLIPEKWKRKTKNCSTKICFDGTIVQVPHNGHGTYYLYWEGGGKWDWGWCWLGRCKYGVDYLSAVIEKPS